MNDIKYRLKLAYENVAFYADKTWAQEPLNYQKANQELYARGTHLDDLYLEESMRPRTVQDCIPQSKLAQYANYEYNEARELSYASSVSDVSFYYPCLYQKSAIKEPWMLPEVEQLFIWLTYSPQFELSSPKHLGDIEDLKDVDNGMCTCSDLHKINPILYEAVERAPGKSRYTDSKCYVKSETPITTIIKTNDFDEMKLKMYLKQDKIKEIWERNPPPNRKNKLVIFKTSLGNYLVHDTGKQHKEDYTNISNIPHYFNDLQEKSKDFRNMQALSESLNMEISSIAPVESDLKNVSSFKINSEQDAKQENVPTRRLYSDVVQGLSPNKTPSLKTRQSDITSPSSARTSTKDNSLASPKTTTSTIFSTEESTIPSPQQKTSKTITSWQNNNKTWSKNSENYKILTSPEIKTKSQTNNLIFTSSKPKTPPPNSTTQKTPIYSTISYADSFSNSHCPLGHTSTWNSLNPPLGNFLNNDFQANDTYSCNAYSSTYQNNSLLNNYTNNFYPNPYQYNQNSLYQNAFTSISYTGCSFANTYTNNSQSTNLSSSRTQPSQNCRTNFTQNTLQITNPTQQAWLLQQYRAPICNVPHFNPQPYILLPQPVSKSSQRWSQPHYIRPNTPQNFHITVSPPQTPPQYWNISSQSLYRTNSNQQVYNPISHQNFDAVSINSNGDFRQKSKIRKQTIQTKIIPNKVLEFSSTRIETNGRNKSNSTSKQSSISSDVSLTSQSYESKAKPPQCDYKYIFKKEQTMTCTTKLSEQKNSVKVVGSISGTIKGFSCSETDGPCLIPVTETASEDLERQALDEYQSSSDSFYKELEKQAEEQYEENSENFVSPPNEKKIFGGLLLLQEVVIIDFIFIFALL